jgi:hypothetical protein
MIRSPKWVPPTKQSADVANTALPLHSACYQN